MWKLNNKLLEKPMYQRRNQRGNQKCLETTESGKTTYKNLCDAAKAILREMFIVINICIKKKDLKKNPNFTLQRSRIR